MKYTLTSVRWLIAVSCLWLIDANAQDNRDSKQETFMELMTKKEFPVAIKFSENGKEYTLTATGAVYLEREGENQEKIPMYYLVHYMEAYQFDPLEDLYEQIIAAKAAKQLELILARNTTAEKVQASVKKLLSRAERNYGISLTKMQKEINTLVQMFTGDYEKDEKFIFRWLPNGHMIVILPDNKKKAINSGEFAGFFWRIWFGLMSPVDRGSLVSRVKLF